MFMSQMWRQTIRKKASLPEQIIHRGKIPLAVVDLDGNPLLNLAQWKSKYINIVVLTICHIKQLHITVFQ